MIAAAMLYALSVTTLLSLAGLAAERLAALHGGPLRAAWAATLLASFAVPLATLSVAEPPARYAEPGATAVSMAAPVIAAVAADLAVPAQARFVWPQRPALDRALGALCLLSAAAVLLYLALASVMLRRRARRWRTASVDGHAVWIAEQAGPAVIGFVRPRIVLPRWLLDAPASTRAMVLAHEQAHVAARDPSLLVVALLAVALAPWNLPLWWQLRRLRFAIEVDCDRRVMRGGADRVAYGEVLLSMGQRRAQVPHGAVALIEPAPELERRIRIMMAGTDRKRMAPAAVLLAMSASLAVAAVRVEAPASLAAAVELRKPPPQSASDPPPAYILAFEFTIKERYPQLLTQAVAGTPIVTVLFNSDGSVDRTDLEIFSGRAADFHATEARFQRFGLAPESVGYVGLQGVQSAANEILVVYSDHRTPHVPYVSTLFADRSAIDRALVERYFPGAFASGLAPGEGLWVLLDHEGRVLRTGREPFEPANLNRILEARFAGIEISASSATPMAAARGGELSLNCVWLAPGSPAPAVSAP